MSGKAKITGDLASFSLRLNREQAERRELDAQRTRRRQAREFKREQRRHVILKEIAEAPAVAIDEATMKRIRRMAEDCRQLSKDFRELLQDERAADYFRLERQRLEHLLRAARGDEDGDS